MRLKDGFDDLDLLKEPINPLELGQIGSYDYASRSQGFSASLPLLASRMPYNKAVVIVRLNNLKTSYGVRISWTGMTTH